MDLRIQNPSTRTSNSCNAGDLEDSTFSPTSPNSVTCPTNNFSGHCLGTHHQGPFLVSMHNTSTSIDHHSPCCRLPHQCLPGPGSKTANHREEFQNTKPQILSGQPLLMREGSGESEEISSSQECIEYQHLKKHRIVSKRKKYRCIFSIFLVGVNILLLCAIPAGFIYLRQAGVSSEFVCMPYGDLKKSFGYLADRLSDDEDNTTKNICFKSVAELLELTREFVTLEVKDAKAQALRHGLEKLPQTQLSLNKPVAHVLGQSPGNARGLPPGRIGEQTIIWSAETTGGLAKLIRVTDDGRLVVPSTGIYYIYSQVYIQPMRRTDSTATCRPFVHYLYKHMADRVGPTKIAQSPHKECQTVSRNSFVAVIAMLYANESVSVVISNISMISHSPESSHFGLFLI